MTLDAIQALEPGVDGVLDGFFLEDDMSRYPIPHYSKRQVIKAGDLLRGKISEEMAEEALQVFRIAYDWRNSHAYPMRKVRHELGGRIRRLQASAITAGRMKRMVSIRKKLARLSINLAQIQDLGGCRAILNSMDNARALIHAYQNGASVHAVRNVSDYVERPKNDGYRSYHLVVAFQGQDKEQIYDGRRIEIQIRTELQHSWATAVEAVGLFRGEDLKGGEGDRYWLQLFRLMSSEFAETEGCPTVPGTPPLLLRKKEIRDLNQKLKAIDTLENLAYSFRAAETFLGTPYARYFVLHYDKEAGVVGVRTLAESVWTANQPRDEQSPDAVLVEVDKVENLRNAYPNYFGDVRAFVSNLKRVVYGYDASLLVAWRKRQTV